MSTSSGVVRVAVLCVITELIDEMKKRWGVLGLEAVRFIRFVRPWRSGLKADNGRLKFTFQALWIIVVIVWWMVWRDPGVRPRSGRDRSVCQKVTRDGPWVGRW